MSDNSPHPRRLGVYWIGVHSMLDIIAIAHGQGREDAFWALRFLEGPPADAKVVNVWLDNTRHAFGFLMEHESFPVVEEGMPAETLGMLQIQARRVEDAGPSFVIDDSATP